jgi:hypothetical protein
MIRVAEELAPIADKYASCWDKFFSRTWDSMLLDYKCIQVRGLDDV